MCIKLGWPDIRLVAGGALPVATQAVPLEGPGRRNRPEIADHRHVVKAGDTALGISTHQAAGRARQIDQPQLFLLARAWASMPPRAFHSLKPPYNRRTFSKPSMRNAIATWAANELVLQ
jgi:hypothetical protein